MEQTTTTTPPGPPGIEPTLVRPVGGRMLAGVSIGLARRFGLPLFLIRALFVIFAIAGGLGIALYATGWFLIRSEEEAESPAERFFSGAVGIKSWFGIAFVFVAILILLENFTFISGGIVWALALLILGIFLYTGDLPRLSGPPQPKEGVQQMTTLDEGAGKPGDAASTALLDEGPGEPTTPPLPTPPDLPEPAGKPKEPSFLGRLTFGFMALGLGILAIFDNTTELVSADARHYVALAITILGAGLLVGAFAGRARWLILVGLLAIPGLLASMAFDWGWRGDGIDRHIIPTTFTELRPSYTYDVGEIVIDLTHLPWSDNDIEIVASLDAGNIHVLVPEDVAITGSAVADVGRVSGPGNESFGIGDLVISFDEPGSTGSVGLNLEIGVGNIEVDQVPQRRIP